MRDEGGREGRKQGGGREEGRKQREEGRERGEGGEREEKRKGGREGEREQDRKEGRKKQGGKEEEGGKGDESDYVRKKVHHFVPLSLYLGYLLGVSTEVFHQYHSLACTQPSLVWASRTQSAVGEEWHTHLSCP